MLSHPYFPLVEPTRHVPSGSETRMSEMEGFVLNKIYYVSPSDSDWRKYYLMNSLAFLRVHTDLYW